MFVAFSYNLKLALVAPAMTVMIPHTLSLLFIACSYKVKLLLIAPAMNAMMHLWPMTQLS